MDRDELLRRLRELPRFFPDARDDYSAGLYVEFDRDPDGDWVRWDDLEKVLREYESA